MFPGSPSRPNGSDRESFTWIEDQPRIVWSAGHVQSPDIPSLKLTHPLKIDGCKMILSLLGWPIFRGELLVLGRVFDFGTSYCSSSSLNSSLPIVVLRKSKTILSSFFKVTASFLGQEKTYFARKQRQPVPIVYETSLKLVDSIICVLSIFKKILYKT